MAVPDISVIIVSYNTRELLLSCLQSVYASREAGNVEVVVVDNASTDGTREAVVREWPAVRWIENAENIGFAGATNVGLAASSGQYRLLLNSDTEIRPDCLNLLRSFMETHPAAGAIGPRLVYIDGRTQPSADSFPNLFTEFLHLFGFKRLLPGETARRLAAPVLTKVSGKTVGTYFQTYTGSLEPREVDCVSGACLLISADVYEVVGGLDTSFFMYMEDMDWCVRIKAAGFGVYYVPEVEVVHHVGASGEADPATAERVLVTRYQSRLQFFAKHRGRGANFLERVMVVKAFALRWPFSHRRRAYGKIIRMAWSAKSVVRS
jgi:GT2 family glycosyltransferase